MTTPRWTEDLWINFWSQQLDLAVVDELPAFQQDAAEHLLSYLFAAGY